MFRALNIVEVVLALCLIAGIAGGQHAVPVLAVAALVLAVSLLQLAVIRPRLNRRTARVLAGHQLARSSAHLAYIAAEGTKVLALLSLGVLLLA